MTRLMCVVLACGLLGCFPRRVTIRAVPEKTAPRAERVAAMKELLPEGGIRTTYFVNGMKSGVYMTSNTEHADALPVCPALQRRAAPRRPPAEVTGST